MILNFNGEGLPLTLDEVEKEHIKQVLSFNNGNKFRTAEMLGIARTTLLRKLREFEISDWRNGG